MPSGGSNTLLNLNEAAEYLNLRSPRTLRDNWQRWGIRVHYVGRELRFRERDLESYLERTAVGGAA